MANKHYQTPDSSVESGITHLSVLVAKRNIDDSVSSVASNSTLLKKTSFLNHDVSAYATHTPRTLIFVRSLMPCVVPPVCVLLHERRMCMQRFLSLLL